MAGPSNAAIRARLREQAVDYVLSHGWQTWHFAPWQKF
jgi:hypothetical protein